MNYKRFLLSSFCLVLFSLFYTNVTAQKTFNIGVAGSAPFVVDTQLETGISLEIWQAIANEDNFDYKLIPYHDVPNALADLDSGTLDAVVGPISITASRSINAKFTQPYYQSSLSIMSRTEPPSLWQRVKPFFSIRFFYAVFIFLFILSIVGTFLWLAERKKNPEEFPHQPTKGIANGMWCAIVTMTTTGYGDLSPKTLKGRVIAGSWMIISIVFATTMVAGIASTLTLSGFSTNTITKANQLANKKVALVKDSPADEFVQPYGTKEVYVQTLEEAYRALKTGKVDAIVFDRPQLLYFHKTHKDENVVISRDEYIRQGYGFAVPINSQDLHEIDITLLKLQESGRVERIINTWLGEDNH
ncbi:MAG TPA: transporter substrate-binding domain-containing protein [Chitinophagaceae bacterium]|nr:transporter substrate-binding domain-containing protein [Chitinophagaceae bacterium]